MVKNRFTDNIIEILLKLKWWDWPIEKIKKHVAVLCSSDLSSLEKIYSERNGCAK